MLSAAVVKPEDDDPNETTAEQLGFTAAQIEELRQLLSDHPPEQDNKNDDQKTA